MLVQKLIPLSALDEWNDAIAKVPMHAYTHTHWYNEAMHLASGRDVYLYSGQDQQFHVICPISPRQKSSDDARDITTPYGFSGFAQFGKCPNFHTEWKQFMRSQGYVAGHIACHPLNTYSDLDTGQVLYEGKKTYLIDMSKPLDDIFKGFSTDHRQRLKQWKQKGYVVEYSDKPTISRRFIDLYEASLVERGAEAVYNFGSPAWEKIIASPYTHAFSVKSNEIVEAIALFIAYQDFVDYYMIASTREGRLHARGIISEALTYFKNNEFRWLHLGCGIKENDALELFKARFGGEPRATYALKEIYDPQKYKSLCMKYQTNASDMQGYFPSYWRQTKEVTEVAC